MVISKRSQINPEARYFLKKQIYIFIINTTNPRTCSGVPNFEGRKEVAQKWIKSYNGNSNGYYYELVIPQEEGVKPYWILRRTNIHNHNYVGAISGRAE